ncbi:MAG: PrsW family intramembrane metalloprotease [Clostridia bacterium]|nr:PrsW family intramembrane metalloprotease [Clostridia bacterium]MBQ8973923.1 PrsW family intramembrane metalloprotease [Clostridia bacterium]
MFFYYIPNTVLVAAAVIPAIALLVYVYRQDHIEKEPIRLLASLVLYGILATFIAKVVERLGSFVLDSVLTPNSLLSDIILYFGIVAYAEEGAKYALLKRRTWEIADFNCQFDGVVYAVFVALGFALWENIGYVTIYGLGTALIRSVSAIPGHACFGVFMGCWYARSYSLHVRGYEGSSKVMRVLAVVLPAALHGAYDFLATESMYSSAWPFVIFIAALFFITFHLVRKLAREDRFI